MPLKARVDHLRYIDAIDVVVGASLQHLVLANHVDLANQIMATKFIDQVKFRKLYIHIYDGITSDELVPRLLNDLPLDATVIS